VRKGAGATIARRYDRRRPHPTCCKTGASTQFTLARLDRLGQTLEARVYALVEKPLVDIADENVPHGKAVKEVGSKRSAGTANHHLKAGRGGPAC
jgi:hypothetical protein